MRNILLIILLLILGLNISCVKHESKNKQLNNQFNISAFVSDSSFLKKWNAATKADLRWILEHCDSNQIDIGKINYYYDNIKESYSKKGFNPLERVTFTNFLKYNLNEIASTIDTFFIMEYNASGYSFTMSKTLIIPKGNLFSYKTFDLNLHRKFSVTIDTIGDLGNLRSRLNLPYSRDAHFWCWVVKNDYESIFIINEFTKNKVKSRVYDSFCSDKIDSMREF